MLALLNLEQIEVLLLDVPAIVKRFEERDLEFVTAVGNWLITAEQILTNNRLPLAAEIAAQRGALIAAERGFLNGAQIEGRVNARKMRDARAAELLRKATGMITEAVHPRRAQIDEAERLMMQILAVADRLGLLPPPSPGQNHSAYLQSVFQSIYNRPELTSLVVHVIGLLGRADTLILLDRCITKLHAG